MLTRQLLEQAAWK